MAEGPKNRQVGRTRRLRAAAMVAAIVVGLVFALPGTASAGWNGQITPVLNCYYQNTDGSVTVVLGYRSTYASTQRIGIGTQNYATPSKYSASLPTVFKPGTQNGVATMRVAATDLSYAKWYVDGLTLNYWNVYGATVCTQAQLPAFANGAALAGVLIAAGIAGVLVVRRVRRATLTTRRNGSTTAVGGDHA